MTLRRLRDFLTARGGATLADIARYFELDLESARVIVLHCERRGFLGCRACDQGCGACRGCPIQASRTQYHWI